MALIWVAQLAHLTAIPLSKCDNTQAHPTARRITQLDPEPTPPSQERAAMAR